MVSAQHQRMWRVLSESRAEWVRILFGTVAMLGATALELAIVDQIRNVVVELKTCSTINNRSLGNHNTDDDTSSSDNSITDCGRSILKVVVMMCAAAIGRGVSGVLINIAGQRIVTRLKGMLQELTT